MMRVTNFLFRYVGTVVLAALVSCIALSAQAKDAKVFTPKQQNAIEEIVHDYLVEHPEVIVKAMQALEAKQAKQQADKANKAFVTHSKKIFNDPTSVVVGNPKGDVTIVEFFDYQCGYCKHSLPEILALIQHDKNIRLVLKEYPILGPDSATASKAALASVSQGKYFAFHKALMSHRGGLTDETIFATAVSVGLDLPRLKKDMAAPNIAKIIADNHALADALAINGTPAFYIGNTFVGGAMSEAEMAELVKKARSAKN